MKYRIPLFLSLLLLLSFGHLRAQGLQENDPTLWPEPERAFLQDGPGLLLSAEQRTELRSFNPEARLPKGVVTMRDIAGLYTYDEVEGIARTVASVLDVDYPKESLQVVVAVDGAAAATVCAAREAGATVVPLAVNRGSYAARNAAVAALERPVDVVLFTDADCVAGPGWAIWRIRRQPSCLRFRSSRPRASSSSRTSRFGTLP